MDSFNQQDYEQTEQPVDANESKKSFKSGVRIGILSGVAASLLVVIVVILCIFNSNKILNFSTIAKVEYIEKLINYGYFGDVDKEAVRDNVYKGIVSGLGDEYSQYFTKSEYAEEQIGDTGKYDGVGMVLSQDRETKIINVSRVYKGSPAEKAGIKNGDQIISADDVTFGECEDLSEFVNHLRGEPNTTVDITYMRDNQQTTVTVTRENITIETIDYRMLDNNVGYVEITSFAKSTADEFKAAMDDLQSQGMKSVIFDLRYNGGGMVDACVEMLDYVLPEGTVVYTVDKKGKKVEYTSDAEHYIKMPIVVLTNEYTASSSEIFTGAIRDFKYGTVIGTKTYGKGVVQGTVPLKDGSAVKITMAKYYTPKGECINEKGISPDIEIEYEYNADFKVGEYDYYADNQIQKALEVLTD